MEQQINNSTQPSSLQGKRPILITILCILGFLGVGFPLISDGPFKSIVRDVIFQQGGPSYVPTTRELIIQQYSSFIPILIFTTLLGLIGLVGYWKMRKWGVYVYTAMAILSIGYYGLIIGISGIFSSIPLLVFPLVIVGVGFANLKKMA